MKFVNRTQNTFLDCILNGFNTVTIFDMGLEFLTQR